jgi:hypothetical protein
MVDGKVEFYQSSLLFAYYIGYLCMVIFFGTTSDVDDDEENVPYKPHGIAVRHVISFLQIFGRPSQLLQGQADCSRGAHHRHGAETHGSRAAAYPHTKDWGGGGACKSLY